MMTAFKSRRKAFPAGVIYEDFNTLVVLRAIRMWKKAGTMWANWQWEYKN